MSIIKIRPRAEKEAIRISLDKQVLDNVKQYCAWLGVKKPDDFFEQAAEYVLAKDKEWLNKNINETV
jgi:hypothetical protein